MQVRDIPVAVFPLKLIDTYMDGYYLDKDFNVWSTKGRSPSCLSGTKTPSGKYFTLNKRAHRADDIARRARNHKDFASHTAALVPVPATTGSTLLPLGRTKSAKELASRKGFVLATMSPTDKLIFGSDSVFHLTAESARGEAERIAGVSGIEVVVLQVIGKVKVQKAVWE